VPIFYELINVHSGANSDLANAVMILMIMSLMSLLPTTTIPPRNAPQLFQSELQRVCVCKFPFLAEVDPLVFQIRGWLLSSELIRAI
jgi:hypothetical protein